MYTFILLFTFMLSYSNSLTLYDSSPSCSSCKWFIPSNKGGINDHYGLCKLYKNNYDINGNKLIIYEYAKHCRKNKDMCGQQGFLYDKKIDDYEFTFKNYEHEELLEKILDQYDELNNRGWGEVNESEEIEEIEEDFIRLFEKVKYFMEKKNIN